MAFGGKRNRAEIVHRADANMHDYYGAMGETADFEEAFEPDAPAASPSASDSSAAPSFARFQLLYESRDGKMAVFEDEHGHIVAVDTARLA